MKNDCDIKYTYLQNLEKKTFWSEIWVRHSFSVFMDCSPLVAGIAAGADPLEGFVWVFFIFSLDTVVTPEDAIYGCAFLAATRISPDWRNISLSGEIFNLAVIGHRKALLQNNHSICYLPNGNCVC